jgi:hypothetical protein
MLGKVPSRVLNFLSRSLKADFSTEGLDWNFVNLESNSAVSFLDIFRFLSGIVEAPFILSSYYFLIL